MRRLVFLLFLSGCSLSVDYSGSHFLCTDGQCPSGFECRAQLCEALDGPDAAVPVIVDAGPDAPPGTPDAPPPPPPDATEAQCNGTDQVFDPLPGGHCYTLIRTTHIWVDAAVACQTLAPNTHLAQVTSSHENSVIAVLTLTTSPTLSWLGGTDGPSEGDWRWVNDGTAFPPSPGSNAFQHWNSGEPNNGGTSGTPENCLAIQLGSTNHGGWDDRNCSDLRTAVCETE